MRCLTLVFLLSAAACSGCASGIRATAPPTGLADVIASDDVLPVDSPGPASIAAAQLPISTVAIRARETAIDAPALEGYDSAEALGASEEIPAPAPSVPGSFKPRAEDETNLDRFNRDILDVQVDIRPTAGEMPEDRGAERFAGQPVIDETFPSGEPADVLCSYTPWTICYRPLYFEDIGLERYGKNAGCLQTGLSGVRFFGSIAALPYKMTRRPPRSCECSNGFSRPGDCPLPGYGNRRLDLDAALIEAAAITAVVYIIP